MYPEYVKVVETEEGTFEQVHIRFLARDPRTRPTLMFWVQCSNGEEAGITWAWYGGSLFESRPIPDLAPDPDRKGRAQVAQRTSQYPTLQGKTLLPRLLHRLPLMSP